MTNILIVWYIKRVNYSIPFHFELQQDRIILNAKTEITCKGWIPLICQRECQKNSGNLSFLTLISLILYSYANQGFQRNDSRILMKTAVMRGSCILYLYENCILQAKLHSCTQQTKRLSKRLAGLKCHSPEQEQHRRKDQ